MNSVYGLVTVAKNEESFIEYTILSVLAQSIKPVYYVIVDDGSEDNTPIIINKYVKKYPWIINIRMPVSKWDIGVHYAHICKFGFDTLIDLCKTNCVKLQYIALLDADSIMEKDYFLKIFEKFYQYPDLGVTSGGFYHEVDGQYIWTNTRLDFSGGTGRCWDIRCFEETDGYLIDVCPDYVSNIRVKAIGCNTYKFPEIVGVEQRKTGSGSMSWNGYAKIGYFDYHLYLNPILVFAKLLLLTVKHKSFETLGYFYGYLSSFIRRKKTIEDCAVRSYCMNVALKDMWTIYIVNSSKKRVNRNENLIMGEVEVKYFKSISRD